MVPTNKTLRATQTAEAEQHADPSDQRLAGGRFGDDGKEVVFGTAVAAAGLRTFALQLAGF